MRSTGVEAPPAAAVAADAGTRDRDGLQRLHSRRHRRGGRRGWHRDRLAPGFGGLRGPARAIEAPRPSGAKDLRIMPGAALNFEYRPATPATMLPASVEAGDAASRLPVPAAALLALADPLPPPAPTASRRSGCRLAPRLSRVSTSRWRSPSTLSADPGVLPAQSSHPREGFRHRVRRHVPVHAGGRAGRQAAQLGPPPLGAPSSGRRSVAPGDDPRNGSYVVCT